MDEDDRLGLLRYVTAPITGTKVPRRPGLLAHYNAKWKKPAPAQQNTIFTHNQWGLLEMQQRKKIMKRRAVHQSSVFSWNPYELPEGYKPNMINIDCNKVSTLVDNVAIPGPTDVLSVSVVAGLSVKDERKGKQTPDNKGKQKRKAAGEFEDAAAHDKIQKLTCPQSAWSLQKSRSLALFQT